MEVGIETIRPKKWWPALGHCCYNILIHIGIEYRFHIRNNCIGARNLIFLVKSSFLISVQYYTVVDICVA